LDSSHIQRLTVAGAADRPGAISGGTYLEKSGSCGLFGSWHLSKIECVDRLNRTGIIKPVHLPIVLSVNASLRSPPKYTKPDLLHRALTDSKIWRVFWAALRASAVIRSSVPGRRTGVDDHTLFSPQDLRRGVRLRIAPTPHHALSTPKNTISTMSSMR
jgi:hypothetical protein